MKEDPQGRDIELERRTARRKLHLYAHDKEKK